MEFVLLAHQCAYGFGNSVCPAGSGYNFSAKQNCCTSLDLNSYGDEHTFASMCEQVQRQKSAYRMSQLRHGNVELAKSLCSADRTDVGLREDDGASGEAGDIASKITDLNIFRKQFTSHSTLWQ
jgi:hypothetical protein